MTCCCITHLCSVQYYKDENTRAPSCLNPAQILLQFHLKQGSKGTKAQRERERDYSHVQYKVELPKQPLLGAIFLVLFSFQEGRQLLGDTWILSMKLILGASRIALGRERAHCIPQMERGLMYMRDLKCPSTVHASGVWNQQLWHRKEQRNHFEQFQPQINYQLGLNLFLLFKPLSI